jgi:hypothetical protein
MERTGPDEDETWWVACLCAAWCGVCRDWLPMFTEQAGAHPHMRFAWVDVEDEDEAMGEMDIETFPTLLVARGGQALFLGPVPPSGTQLARLITSLQAQPRPQAGLPAAAQGLFRRLRTAVLPRTSL